MDDGDELTADTDPSDPSSALRITTLEPDLLGIRLDWQGGSAAWQVLEYKADLSKEQWHPILAVPPPTPESNTIIDAGATDPTLYYRLRAVRP